MIIKDIWQWEDIIIHHINGTNMKLKNFTQNKQIQDNTSIAELNKKLKQYNFQPLKIHKKHIDIDSKYLADVFYEQQHDRVEIVLDKQYTLLVSDGAIFNVQGFFYIFDEDTMTLEDENSEEICVWNINSNYNFIEYL